MGEALSDHPIFPVLFLLPDGSEGKESACKAGDPGSIPGLGRSPGERHGYPLQYSCLEISIDRGTWGWAATVHDFIVRHHWVPLSLFMLLSPFSRYTVYFSVCFLPVASTGITAPWRPWLLSVLFTILSFTSVAHSRPPVNLVGLILLDEWPSCEGPHVGLGCR